MSWRRYRGIDAQFAAMLAAIGAIVAAAAWTGTVRDLDTAGSLSSVLGFAATVVIFWIARLLSGRIRRARISLLRRDDLRNRNHMIAMANLCKSLMLGARGADPGSPAALAAMRDTALYIGEFGTTYGHLLTGNGKRLAERVRAAALTAVAGKSCATVDVSHMLGSLGRLEGEILDVDSGELVRRREQEADAGDPARE